MSGKNQKRKRKEENSIGCLRLHTFRYFSLFGAAEYLHAVCCVCLTKQKGPTTKGKASLFGAGGEIRTLDLLITNQLHYPCATPAKFTNNIITYLFQKSKSFLKKTCFLLCLLRSARFFCKAACKKPPDRSLCPCRFFDDAMRACWRGK